MNIKESCLEILAGILVQEGELAAVAQGGGLLSSGSFDSLALVNLIVALENRFKIQIDSDDFESIFASLDSLAGFIESKRVG